MAFYPGPANLEQESLMNLVLIVALLDGGQINMRVDEKTKWDIMTRHGQLSVPLKDMGSCMLSPRGDNDRINLMIKRLGSDNFHERDEAMKYLALENRNSYKLLKEKEDDKNQERKERIRILLKEYTNIPPTIDLIHLRYGGQYSGIVSAKEIEGTSDALGLVKVSLGKVRSVSVVVPMASIKIKYLDRWTNAGFISTGRLKISAFGTMDLWPQTPGTNIVGPNGHEAGHLKDGYPFGALIGRVRGRTFLVGSDFFSPNVEAGELELRINGTTWGQFPVGEYEVTIE